MYHSAYAEIAADDQAEARRREHRALEVVLGRLSAAQAAFPNEELLCEALDAMESLWAIFMKDVSGPENALPLRVRENVLAIGRWIFERSAEQRNGRADNLALLIEMNATIRDGLKTRS